MTKPLVERALEVVEKESSSGAIPRIVLEAPTGYGKSFAAPLFAGALIRHGLGYSFIHSLPLRAIVRDIYLCLLINSLTNDTKLRTKCKKSEEALRKVAEALRSVSIDLDQVAYQMGDLILSDVEIVRKEPLFNARYVVTTLDSLAYNAFRIPVTEIFNPRKHYAIPRLRIFLSALYLDEAHTVYEEEEDLEKGATVFRELLKVSKAGNIPLVIASATLSNDIEKQIIDELREVKVIKLSEKDGGDGNYIYVRDDEFEDFVKSITWKTSFIMEEELISMVGELVETDLRVFIARDTICSAIKTYRELKSALGLGDSEITLLHGLMTRHDREEALKKLDDGSIRVLVATSVVEAGVDISFDVLITDGGRPASIIQRAGRVCRTPSACRTTEVWIYLLKNQYLNPEVEEFIIKAKQNGKEVCWRLPYDVGNNVSYMRLLNNIKKTVKIDEELARKLRALTSPLYVSSTTINTILERLGYAMIRTHLAEVLVRRDKALQQELGRLDFNIMVTSLGKLALLTRRGCVEGLYAVFDDGVKKVDDVSPHELSKNRALERELLRKYVNVLKSLMGDHALKYKVRKIAYLLKEYCYADGEGVEYGMLCLQRRDS